MKNRIATIVQQLKANGQYQTYEEKYSTSKTDEDQIKITLRLLRDVKYWPSLLEPSTKSITISENYREQGNNSFVTPQLDTTIELYTKAIASAPPGSRQLAIGYANRSAALFKARLYQDCLQDISRALTSSYPDDLKAKVYARRAKCLMTLKSPTKDQENELKEALKMATEYLDKIPANGKGRQIVEEMLKEPEKMIPLEGEYIKWRGEDYIPKVSDESSEIKGVSSALQLEFNEAFGRHVVATRDIRPGEVLGVMTPYAGVLVRDKWFTHCAYCTQQTWSSVPCEGCCHVIYCNEDCKSQAYNEYHDVECHVTRHLVALGMDSLARFNVRLTVKAIKETGSIQVLREKVKQIEDCKDPRTIGFTQGFLDDKDYASVYTLARNTEKRSFTHLLERSLESILILLALATKSDLFGKKFRSKLDDLEGDTDVTFVGGLILRHQQIFLCNSHLIHEDDFSINPPPTALMLMPFSQMNHSCNPTVTKTIYGKKMVFYANYAVKKGEQIFDSYGQHYASQPRSQRQMELQENFYFSCKCIACAENWPTIFEGIPSFFSQCQSVRTKDKFRHVTRNFSQYIEVAFNGNFTNPTAIIADMNNMVEFLQKNCQWPCKELTQIIEIRKRILGLIGRRFQSVNLAD